jgi:hypothetical protein
MAPFVAPGSFFESDGIHLNSDAGHQFVHFLVGNADAMFPDVVPSALTSVIVPSPSPAPSASGPSTETLADKVAMLDVKLSRRISQDNLIFARIKEDRDLEINRSKEDRFTLSGLRLPSIPPPLPKDRKEFFKSAISDLILKACPDLDPPAQVLDVLINMRPNRGPPIFEVKTDSVASSLAFRLAASKLAKAKVGEFSGVFVTNTVNLSTRIRIDILKELSKKLTSSSEVAYVQAFSSRPTLHLRPRDDDSSPPGEENAREVTVVTPGRSFTFTESMSRWGHLLSASSLGPIRRKAATAFKGCLEQYFVVLSDDEPAQEPDSDSFYSRLFPTGSAPPTRGFRGRGPSARRPWPARWGSQRPSPGSNKRSLDSDDSHEPANKK